MFIDSIRLKDFRAHTSSELEFNPRMNLICGPNGIGKTNVLEAIHFLSLTKSFLTSTDQYLLRRDAAFFEIEGNFTGERRKSVRVRAAFVPREGKRLFVNDTVVERKADHIGTIPTVLLCPQDYALTSGGPAERRRFINNIICQSSATYLNNLLRYRRALKQRNEVLYRIKRSGLSGGDDILEPWTNELVDLGSQIVSVRMKFCDTFSQLLLGAHKRLGEAVEKPSIQYLPFGRNELPNDESLIRESFSEVLRAEKKREKRRGISLVGPHRDEIVFLLDGEEVRRYASQGQHRTFGMALKLAQFHYLKNVTEETPIMLLDDVFDNLDGQRIALFLDILQSEEMGQCIVTAARKEILDGFVDFDAESNKLISLPMVEENISANGSVHTE